MKAACMTVNVSCMHAGIRSSVGPPIAYHRKHWANHGVDPLHARRRRRGLSWFFRPMVQQPKVQGGADFGTKNIRISCIEVQISFFHHFVCEMHGPRMIRKNFTVAYSIQPTEYARCTILGLYLLLNHSHQAAWGSSPSGYVYGELLWRQNSYLPDSVILRIE